LAAAGRSLCPRHSCLRGLGASFRRRRAWLAN
jgi:hypothetical protein